MTNLQFVDQTKKAEDFPNEVYFCFTNEGELQQTANASTVKYFRADIAEGEFARLEDLMVQHYIHEYDHRRIVESIRRHNVSLEMVKNREEKLLSKLRSAQDSIEEWGAYASDYFKEKHGLDATLLELDVFINNWEELK